MNLKFLVTILSKFEYSPLGAALNNNTKSRADKRNKIVNTNKQHKNLICNSQYSFVMFSIVFQ